MIVNNEEFKKKINLLGMAVSKNVASKLAEHMIRFECIDGIVYGFSYDSINNIRVEIGPSDKDFYAVVDYKMFSDFIRSCDGDITLEPTGKFIHIKSSNVKCKLPTYNHETKRGQSGIEDPTGNYDYSRNLSEDIPLGILKSVLNPNFEIEAYRNIYFGDNVMVSDTDNVLILEKRIFDEDILLNLSSVEILNSCTNVTYSYANKGTLRLLCVKSDELCATMVITNNDNNDFQYNDFMDLFDALGGASVLLDTSVLSRAVSAASMFKTTPNIVFNSKGIFLRIDNVEFIYKISDAVCEDHTFELTPSVAKKMIAIGKEISVSYTNADLIKCEVDGIREILSAKEVVSND